jgi:hypothetical protein
MIYYKMCIGVTVVNQEFYSSFISKNKYYESYRHYSDCSGHSCHGI